MNWIWWPSLLGVPGAVLLLAAFVDLYAGRRRSGVRRLVKGIFFATVAAAAGLLALSLQSYWRITYETPIIEISIQARDLAQKRFTVVIRHLDGAQPQQTCEMQGDEWLLSARVQKWKSWATLFGVDATYTLDQMANKYVSAIEANGKPITACALNGPRSAYVPPQWLVRLASPALIEDRRFGSATYMPLADGAVYTVLMTQSGLNAEPANARAASTQPESLP